MKKLISIILTICILLLTFSSVLGVSAAASGLSQEEIDAKNYPLPEGYQINHLITYDTASECTGTQSSDEGTFFDGSSNKIKTSQYWSEARAFNDFITLYDSTGFMFWYKSDSKCSIRLRSNNNVIVVEGTLPACPEGQWVTYYYFGKCINFSFKSDMKSDTRTTISNTENTYRLNIFATSDIVYIDEFITFSPKLTPADSYENDEQAFKFSLARYCETNSTIAEYFDDGSVELKGSSVSISYNLENERFKNAIEIAKQKSGYLQITCDNISCKNSSDEDAYVLLTITIDGINKNVKKYTYGSGSSDTYRIKVSDIESVSDVSKITVKASGAASYDIKLSPITVFYFPEDELILQAEYLNPRVNTGDDPIKTSSDGNETYAYIKSSATYIAFDLPELEVGEYSVYARMNAIKPSKTVAFDVCVNNLRQLLSVKTEDETYSSQRHLTSVEIGKIKITKKYEYGASELKFKVVPGCSAEAYFDYFSFVKTDEVVEAEPASNFEIKPYPEMEDYEVKTVLNTFDTYICGSDSRWYNNQPAGYVGDGTAFNLNSRGTYGKGNFDNNSIYYNPNKTLDGNGIRFWYKSNGPATFQFYGNGAPARYYTQQAMPEGGWVIIYYKDLVADGDMSTCDRIHLKNSWGDGYYVDELHTIWEKEGDLKYELNGDGTASVVGYNLRLEEVTIAETYQGCPVVSINDGALQGSLTLKSVELPSSVVSIGENAFEGCLNLKTVNLENVTTISDNAFNNCEKLTDLYLASDTDNISPVAFENCTSLYFNVTNGSNQKKYASDNGYDYKCVTDNGLQYYRDFADADSTVNIIGYSGESASVIIPQTIDSASVVKVLSGAFSENEIIESVVLPNCLTTVESSSFSSCSALKSIEMKGVVTIGENAFDLCTLLENVQVDDNLSTIGKKAFSNCKAVKEFYFGDSITAIGDGAFQNASPNAVMTDRAYTEKTGYSYEYVNLKGFKYYPDNDSTFEYYVENYVASISGYKLNDSIVEIPSEIDGYTVSQVAENAFKNNTVIKTVVFNENMRNINDYAFYGCSALNSVSFTKSLRKISDYAFASCKSLLSVSLTNVVVVSATAFDSTTKINIEQTDFIRNALDYVDGMTAGWNLGNTLDAHSGNYGYGDLTVTQSEQLWRHYNYISQDLFNMVVEKFNTIRIPITWNAFINPNDNYNIDKDFMDRIQEVVDMCYKAGFKYIIINTHHDSDYYFNVHPDNDHEVSKEVIRRVWEQICERFEDYDEKLIFESMNEIRSQGADIGGNGDWYGHSEDLFVRLNNLNKIFVETVRNSGGNNSQRYLMIQSYGGQKDNYQLSKMWLPSVEEDDHIIGSVHWYIETLTEAHYTPNLERLQNYFVNKGIPCVIGEIGLPAYYDQGVITVYDDDYREKWGSFVFGLFEKYRLKAIIWEDHGTYSTVSCSGGNYSWKFPKYVESIYNTTKKSYTDTTSYTVTIDGAIYQTLSEGSELVLPQSTTDGFVCYSDGSNNYNAGDTITVNSDIALTSLTIGEISMMYGASMRLSDVSGLRYYTTVDSVKIQALRDAGLSVEMGTMIAPMDLLNDSELTFEDVTVYQPGMSSGEYQCVVVKYESEKYFQNGNTFVGTISNIKSSNVSRDFVARGYVKVTVNGVEKTFYADYNDNNIKNNSRTIGYVATCVKNDTSFYSKLTDDNKQIVDNYVLLYSNVSD